MRRATAHEAIAAIRLATEAIVRPAIEATRLATAAMEPPATEAIDRTHAKGTLGNGPKSSSDRNSPAGILLARVQERLVTRHLPGGKSLLVFNAFFPLGCLLGEKSR